MSRFQIQQDAERKSFVAEVSETQPGQTFATRREADERLIDSVPKTRMTPAAWEALAYLRET